MILSRIGFSCSNALGEIYVTHTNIGDISQWYQIALEQGATLDKVSYELHLDLTMSIE